MLPGVTLPASLAVLLGALRPCFTAPSFRTFCGLAAGLAGQVRRRTVVGMLLGAGLGRAWPHDRAHYFFARARWQAGELGLAVARLVVLLLVPPADPLTVAVDDSVFRRSGRKVHGAGWQYDGSSPDRDRVSFGTCFVTCGIVVRLPFCTRPVCLPVLARLVPAGKTTVPARRRKGKKATPVPGSKVSAAVSLVALLAAAFPGRPIDVVADAACYGPALKHLPPSVSWTCRLRANAVLYDLAPPRPPGTKGRPRRKGGRLGTPGQLAATAGWVPAAIRIYGRDQAMSLAGLTCLWYGCLDTATVRVILARDDTSRPALLALVTTDLAASTADLITRYAARWSTGSGLRRRPHHPRRRRSPQPHPPRRRAHRPVRPAHPHPDHHLVRPARPPPGRPRRPPPRPALVPRQDRTRLRGHAHPAPPRPHHRPHFQRIRYAPHTRANPSRPGSLARSSRITAKHERRHRRHMAQEVRKWARKAVQLSDISVYVPHEPSSIVGLTEGR